MLSSSDHKSLIVVAFYLCSSVVESFDCIAMVMRLNHKILEPWLPSLWLLLMAAHHMQDRDILGRECIAIFAKLRQVGD